MDLYSSGEDPAIKARKPYTITKQRERWTEEEHNRFLEALKLYGRAWQRIEEHIGTKTAVQIRSHAQKFFTKLEKEAVVKGFPVGHTFDIEIPPPRPKRKPSNPYPRKTSLTAPTLQVVVEGGKPPNTVSCSSQDKITLDLEKEPEKPFDDGKPGNTDGRDKKGDRCEVFTLLTAAPPSLVAPQKKYTSKEYVIPPKETSHEEDKTSVSHVITEAKGIQKDKSDKDRFQENSSCNTSNIVDSYPIQEKSVQGKIINELTKSKNVNRFPTTEMQEASENYPHYVPVHTLIGSLGMSTQHISPGDLSSAQSFLHQMNGVCGHQNLFMNPVASANPDHHDNTSKSSPNQSFYNYHPILTQQLSCTFSSLIVSALLQNPAAYAAATFAATLSPIQPPSMAAIAAATVAAGTAWWASHGLIPSCPPFHPGFNSPMDISQNTAVDNGKREKSPDLGQLEPNSLSKALPEQLPISKSPVLTLSDSEGSESAKMNSGLATAEESQLVDEPKLTDASKCNNRKQVDRSSCGSNTPSSSEEGDGLENHAHGKEENHIKDKKETKELEAIHSIGDPFGRHIRSTNNNVNDSWKEVSEEGRLAFRALFSRQVLPQSFSPPHNLVNKGKNNTYNDMVRANEKNEVALSSDPSSTGQTLEEGLLSMGLGTKLKSRQTGFIPYKRCSMEAKEDTNVSANCQDEEKGPKRLRLEGQALT